MTTIRSKIQSEHPPSVAGWDVRAMRLFIVGALVLSAILTLRHLLNVELFEKNKLEVGLLLGWLIAKSGTVIDWLFGGSESGTRRADVAAHQQAASATPDKPSPADEPQPVVIQQPDDQPVPVQTEDERPRDV